MNRKLDFKKEDKELYLPGSEPALVLVPTMQYLMVDGVGDPSGEVYQQSVELLYALSYTIKMGLKNGRQPEGYLDYVVPPLEGLWDCDCKGFDPLNRDRWRWVSMIRQPDFITEEIFLTACEQTAKKKPHLDVSKARLSTYEEGLCVQILHKGPYSTEQDSVDKISAYIAQNNLTDECGTDRQHHEIYLSDPRSTPPENLKTIIRHPVKKIG